MITWGEKCNIWHLSAFYNLFLSSVFLLAVYELPYVGQAYGNLWTAFLSRPSSICKRSSCKWLWDNLISSRITSKPEDIILAVYNTILIEISYSYSLSCLGTVMGEPDDVILTVGFSITVGITIGHDIFFHFG